MGVVDGAVTGRVFTAVRAWAPAMPGAVAVAKRTENTAILNLENMPFGDAALALL
jgi:hypothetical protein